MFQFLNEDDHDAKKAQEILTLEQTIQLMKQVSLSRITNLIYYMHETGQFNQLKAQGAIMENPGRFI